MKYIIKESQINNIMFSYLDGLNFIEIEVGDNIYFVSNKGDEYAKIRYENYSMYHWVGVSNELCNELSSFFPMDEDDCDEIVGKWVKNRLNKGGVFVTQQYLKDYPPILRVPY